MLVIMKEQKTYRDPILLLNNFIFFGLQLISITLQSLPCFGFTKELLDVYPLSPILIWVKGKVKAMAREKVIWPKFKSVAAAGGGAQETCQETSSLRNEGWRRRQG